MTDLHDASGILDDERQRAPTVARATHAGAGTERLARFHHYFERTVDAVPAAIALECDGRALTYAELDEQANRLANHLLTRVLRPGARVGVMIGRSVDMYVALLATLKTGATFVPIDPGAPADRVAYMAEDAALDVVLSTSDLAAVSDHLPCPALHVDRAAAQVRAASPQRPQVRIEGDPVAYIIYTSGSSGRPKGVEVCQSSICNYVPMITSVYDVRPTDRVYQGITISFDFSIEEMWTPWAVGATVVAGPTDGRRIGPALADFLEESAITMLFCVPTVLATLDRTIPSIRTVNMGGEACPPELVERWAGPGRRILNTYGPTETTVTCTLAELEPGQPVTIGRPLPTYRVILLDEARRPVPDGQVGEICVGGVGVARGYVGRPDLTAERFIPDPDRPDGARIYRTGDLGRVLPDGQIEYLGRADSEVKVRGHRIDLQEIESVLLEDPDVVGAVVKVLTAPGAAAELAGYVVPAASVADVNDLVPRLHGTLRDKLPGYMVPAYLEVVDSIPMMISGKADRKALPDPVGPRLVSGGVEYVAPATPTEERVAAAWETVLRLEPGTVSVTADFFDDLGGHSLLAATAVSRLRAEIGDSGLSIVDLYSHPTIRTLARRQDDLLCEHAADGAVTAAAPTRPAPPRGWRIALFGTTQVAWLYTVLVVFMLPIAVVYSIHGGQPSLLMVAQLALTFPVSYLVGRWVLPLATVRVLSAGLREGTYPLWGQVHLRVWAASKAMSLAPLNMLSGSPWAAPYLRAVGARVGDACHIGTDQVPLPRFVRLGEGATVGYAVHLNAYDLAEGVLTLGHIDIGAGAMVGANSVLQGPCEIGAGASLREQSLLQAGQHVPEGQTWAGSPAKAAGTTADPVLELMRGCPLAPRTWPARLLPGFAVGLVILELMPLAALVPVVALVWWALLTHGQLAGLAVTAATGPVFVVTTCVLVLGVRRLALPATPVGVHHLRSQLGLEKWFGDKLLELSVDLNNTMYSTLYTPVWLRALGARVGRGAEVSTIGHIDPDLLTLEDGTFVADMASVGSATYCNGHVALRATEVGARAFVGNASFVPSGTHLEEGSLLGVQSVPPATGVPRGTSWLGSPAFFLPRREMYDEFTEAQTYRPSRRQVRRRYVIEFFRVVVPASVLSLSTFGTLYTLTFVAAFLTTPPTVLLTPLVALTFSLLVVLFVAALKWLLVGRYRPRVEPLWSGFVRRTELVTGIYEAAAVPALLEALTGTPVLGPLLRLFGTKVGRRTLVESTYLSEFDLVRISDDVVVGPHASLQTHLFEDRVMKMSTVTLRDRASVGGRAVVLYDSEVGVDATLAPLSLVMKGERLPPRTAWCGIPAQPGRPRLRPGADRALVTP
ncbi:Pls/PosA family non-ribosomal peptide synthetase [Georgenia thermotolerans]|uniref:Amino acid adenylation domain-containing protein n=1 Tax=Georgenia thermotolerans TaxID=527326 RepID=A0A7J5UU55_9MICO|nr:Pls/PosA family non-ribosomal peptide synthetase [Georgenia thermotolerans]KAE8765812.1 amino acid adenylation domain-containing protein [Georgenia thermotolerans]